MKKLLFYFLLLPELLVAQKVSITLSSQRIPPFDCKYYYDSEAGKDTVYHVYCSFQNMKYQTIVDIGSVYLTDSSELHELISDIDKMIPLMGAEASIDKGAYRLWTTTTFPNWMYIEDGKQYTMISRKNLAKWRAWLGTIKLPK